MSMGGCLSSGKEDEEAPPQPKVYSWDKREKVDPKDYSYEKLKGETVCRLPGSVNGQQFSIIDCEDCNIYIFDHTATVSVDRCKNCRFFFGPIKSSIFVRNCDDCFFVLACQQFRSRDCLRMKLSLCCTTLPIIEASQEVEFSCFRGSYMSLLGQFSAAGISVFNNNWSRIHDFTPSKGGSKNWTILTETPGWVAELFARVPADTQANIQLDPSLNLENFVVPFTIGGGLHDARAKAALIIFFSPADRMAKKLIKAFISKSLPVRLVQTKELTVNPQDAEALFGPAAPTYTPLLSKGPLVGLHLDVDTPDDIPTFLLRVADVTGETKHFLSHGSTCAKDLDAFYNFANSKMTV